MLFLETHKVALLKIVSYSLPNVLLGRKNPILAANDPKQGVEYYFVDVRVRFWIPESAIWGLHLGPTNVANNGFRVRRTALLP